MSGHYDFQQLYEPPGRRCRLQTRACSDPLTCTFTPSVQLLWKQAQSLPMFPALGEMESHMFQCINQAAVHEELEDETRRLCDVRPFLPMLKLVTRNCGRADRLLDSKIGVLIGKGEATVGAVGRS